MNLLCKIFGHRAAKGYFKGQPGYFTVSGIVVDGMNHHHIYLNSECERCHKMYDIGRVYVPQVYIKAVRKLGWDKD